MGLKHTSLFIYRLVAILFVGVPRNFNLKSMICASKKLKKTKAISIKEKEIKAMPITSLDKAI